MFILMRKFQREIKKYLHVAIKFIIILIYKKLTTG